MKNRMKWVIKFGRAYVTKFLLLLICILITIAIGNVYPYIFGIMIDMIAEKEEIRVFLRIIFLYAIVFCLNEVLHFGLNMVWAYLKNYFLFDIRREVYQKILNNEGSFWTERLSGDLVKTISDDVEEFMDFIHWNLFYSIGSILELVFSLFLIGHINLQIMFLVCVLVPFIVFFSKIFSKSLRKTYEVVREKEGKIAAWAYEMISGMHELQLLNATKQIVNMYVRKCIDVSRIKIRISKILLFSDRVSEGTTLIGQLLLFGFSIYYIRLGTLSLGGFISIVTYFSICVASLANFSKVFTSVPKNFTSMDRVIQFLEDEIKNDNNSITMELKGKIDFHKVDFSYDDQSNKVLDQLDLHIKEGSIIALVGESGCGKSTIAALIQRIYEANSGNIFIDNVEIEKHSISSLRRQVTVVHQNTLLFEESIRFNISFSDDNKNDDIIWKAISKVGAEKFIKNLPKGLDTVLSSSLQLSGGQIQRIAIARAIYRDSKILVLDEATSALDDKSENDIMDFIINNSEDKTVIIISHKLSTIRKVDKIAVLDRGKIVQMGSHEELLENCKKYQVLFAAQYFSEKEMSYAKRNTRKT